MKIATLATGGIGGYLAVKLSLSGHQIATVARGEHLQAIKEKGLALEGPNGRQIVRPWIATDDTTEIGKVDTIILGVKCGDLSAAAKACLPMLGRNTVVIPFLNGVEAVERLLSELPERNVANGLAKVSNTIAAPGIIKQTGDFAQFIFAERNSKPSSRIETLQAAINASGVNAPVTDDIERDVWSKFVLFSAMSGVTAAARCTIGDILASDQLSKLFMQIMVETAEVGRARGIALPAEIEKNTWEMAKSLPANMRASTAIDLEKGRPLEIDWISGSAYRLANEIGIKAPASETIYALLSHYKNGVVTH
jgi:2-dehydropantoate 2-reductase